MALAFIEAIAFSFGGESMSALIATSLRAASPFEKAAWIFLIVGTVGALLGNASRPLCVGCRFSVGSAIATSAAPAIVAAIAGRRSAGWMVAFQKRFSALPRRRRFMVGILLAS